MIILFFGIGIGIGLGLGWLLWSDRLAERGKYVIGEGTQRSGWEHDGSMYFPEPLVREVHDIDEFTADVTINKADGSVETIRVARQPFSSRVKP